MRTQPWGDIWCSDVMRFLQGLPSESVNCVVTSPPYFGLRNYSVDGQIGLEDSPQAFIARLVELFEEVRRVLREDGTLWLNLGDSYASGEVGRHDSRSEREYGARMNGERQQKTLSTGLPPKNLIGIPWRVAFALQDAGWWLRSDIIWCLSGGTRVYAKTQKGEMPMTIKDMVRLDPATVQLWNGKRWTQVLGWNETPRSDDPIEIELRSGERIGCTPAHEWPTQRGLVRADELRVGDVIQTCRLPEPSQLSMPTMIDHNAWPQPAHRLDCAHRAEALPTLRHVSASIDRTDDPGGLPGGRCCARPLYG